MVLNGPTKKSCVLLILKNFNKNKKSLYPFIYKQSLRKLKGFSDFLKSGADDGTRTHDLRLTKIEFYFYRVVHLSMKSIINKGV